MYSILGLLSFDFLFKFQEIVTPFNNTRDIGTHRIDFVQSLLVLLHEAFLLQFYLLGDQILHNFRQTFPQSTDYRISIGLRGLFDGIKNRFQILVLVFLFISVPLKWDELNN